MDTNQAIVACVTALLTALVTILGTRKGTAKTHDALTELAPSEGKFASTVLSELKGIRETQQKTIDMLDEHLAWHVRQAQPLKLASRKAAPPEEKAS